MPAKKVLALALAVSAAALCVGFGYSDVSKSIIETARQTEPVNYNQADQDPALVENNKNGRFSPLSAVEAVMRLRYRQITHVNPQDLDDLSQRKDVVLLDVREQAEYEVSHLAGAIRIDPKADTQTVLDLAGDVSGKAVVFYCSVGARSSTMAQRVRQTLASQGAAGVYNLSGGIFRWHNEERALYNQSTPTSLVHKFDGYWGRLLRRKDLAITNPVQKQ
ncbi:MAG: rhodanese-like domain-containing protein [Filomicrobium sp.]